jgi:PA14 domain
VKSQKIMTNRIATLAGVIACSLPIGLGLAGPAPALAQGVLGGGFLGEYQPGVVTVSQPAFERRDARIDFAFGPTGPGGSLSPAYNTAGWQSFSGSWTGQVIPATSATYTLTVSADGGVGLYIRPTGSTNWTPLYVNFANISQTGGKAVALTAGTSYDVCVHYWQHQPGGRLQLGWSSPNLPYQVIEAATPLGVNGAAALPGEPGNMFADVMKQAGAFTAYSNGTASVALDGQGWPLADASLPVWSSGRELDGLYQLSFTGRAQVTDWAGLGSFSVGGVAYGAVLPAGIGYDPASNVTTATWIVAASATPTTAMLGFGQTQRSAAAATGSGLTNIRILRPTAPGAAAHPAGTLFSDEYEAFLSNFTGIRFMDYLASTGNLQQHWSDRVVPGQPSQYQAVSGYGWQGKGGSLEYLVALANETGKDVWINIPVGVDDDYVTKLAQLLAFGSDGTNPYASAQPHPAYPPLNSNLKIYLEYGNELWNGAYPQAAANQRLASAAVAAGGSPLAYDGATDPTIWAKRRVVDRTLRISSLFRGVWGDAGMMTRVRPVFEWQYGNTGNTAAIGLTYLENYYDNADGLAHVATPHPVNYSLWGGGAGWYQSAKSPGAGTIAAIFASGETLPSTEGDALWALGFGLHEMGYEGGFEVGGDTPSAVELAANVDPAAQSFAGAAIDEFFALGGGMPFIFNSAGATAYGIASPTIADQNTPKMQAILAAIAAPRPASSFAWPLPIDAGAIPVSFSLGVTPSGTATGNLAQVGDYIAWSVSVATAGTYTLGTDAANPAAVQLRLDGATTGTGSWTGTLTAGLHGIMARNQGPGSVTLTKLLVTASR